MSFVRWRHMLVKCTAASSDSIDNSDRKTECEKLRKLGKIAINYIIHFYELLSFANLIDMFITFRVVMVMADARL